MIFFEPFPKKSVLGQVQIGLVASQEIDISVKIYERSGFNTLSKC